MVCPSCGTGNSEGAKFCKEWQAAGSIGQGRGEEADALLEEATAALLELGARPALDRAERVAAQPGQTIPG